MKTLKFVTFAIVFAAPISAAAMCGGGMHTQTTAQICETGQVWDETSESCVATIG
ncbi:MAG: hypothetical protein AAFP13_04410 [Pseudomonadota bacterium]